MSISLFKEIRDAVKPLYQKIKIKQVGNNFLSLAFKKTYYILNKNFKTNNL